MATATKPETNHEAPALVAPKPIVDPKADPELYGRALLAGKMAEVMAAAKQVEKRGHNDHFNYDYATEGDVATALRGLLAERGICMVPTSRVIQTRPVTTSKGRETFITEVVCQIMFIDSETGASLTAEMPGAGEDGMDKGCFKATTGAIKYVLMKTFALSTGDDPEQSQERSDGARQRGNGQSGSRDYEISDRQRSVIWGKAKGMELSNDDLFRFLAYITDGKLGHPDGVKLRSQLDWIVARLDHLAEHSADDWVLIQRWEVEHPELAAAAGEKPTGASPSETAPVGSGEPAGGMEPPPAGSTPDDDEDIPF
jgi:hypothetical protein